MSITVDCGEGKHALCAGTGHTAYLFPQESRGHDGLHRGRDRWGFEQRWAVDPTPGADT